MDISAISSVLIVEDEYLIAHDLADAFVDAACTVAGPAESLDEGLALAAEDPSIRFAVLDINLAGEKSYPIADILSRRGVPFIFVTGMNGEVVPTRFCSIPICLKPMKAEAVVAEALAHAALPTSEAA